MKNKLNLKTMKEMNEVFKRLCSLRRWTSYVNEGRYNELAKQSLNCIVSYLLAIEAEKEGKKIHWEKFPKIAIYRAFQKVYVYFDTPEINLDAICKIGNIEKELLKTETEKIIREKTDDFCDFICEGKNCYELQIYRAATKIATFMELLENRQMIMEGEYLKKYQEIIRSLEPFESLPGVSECSNQDSKVFKFLSDISRLRNQNRWAAYAYSMECSVLGHLFDTGVFAYFMSLEKEPRNEELAAKMFFMGIFHDIPETWTKDIPSPIKRRIPGFREATEQYENQMMKENVYDVLPQNLADGIKAIMFEEPINDKFHSLIKGADYLSADSECWRQYKAGSRDEYFLWAIQNRKEDIASGEVLLTPICRELHNYFKEYSERILR